MKDPARVDRALNKVAQDLQEMLSTAEMKGTLDRMPYTGIHFTVGELRAVIRALSDYSKPKPVRSTVDGAINTIRAYMRHNGLSIYAIAKQTRLSLTSIRYLHDPDWNPTAVTLRVLASVIPENFDPATIEPDPGYDEQVHAKWLARKERADGERYTPEKPPSERVRF